MAIYINRFIANFERASTQPLVDCLDPDFTDLGLVLLECMEGRPQHAAKRTVEHVKDQRASNRVFGLTKPERWSGCKQLIDFLDDLFNEARSTSAKISKPVSSFEIGCLGSGLIFPAPIRILKTRRPGVHEAVRGNGKLRVCNAVGVWALRDVPFLYFHFRN